MSDDTRKTIEKIEAATKEILSSKEKSIEFLVKTGIYTRKGNLRKPYR